MTKFAVKHNLQELSQEEVIQYLREVSTFIGLDPDLNGLDTIWMDNETGPGKSKVVYARRGTAEILRNLYGIQVNSLEDHIVNGAIVFRATGTNKDGRQEIAIGSKSIAGLTGKTLDDAIMTASTRALRRLTMQFTTLGILDESEVVALIGQTPNPAGSALPAQGSSLPPAFLPPPAVPANNAPGKPVEPTPVENVAPAAPAAQGEQFLGQPEQVKEAFQQLADKEAAKTSAQTPVTAPESTTSPVSEPDVKADKPKRARRPKNTVSLDVEPETVSAQANAAVPTQANVAQVSPAAPISATAETPASPSIPASEPVVVTQVPSSPVGAAPTGIPNEEQMGEYRKKIAIYTKELPASENLGSTQKMRAFITRMSTPPTPPQLMTVTQWEEVIAWFEKFMVDNNGSMKNLVKYINDSLGVK